MTISHSSLSVQPEPNRPVTAAAERTPASDGGGDEGMWVPEEYLGHEAAARELESEAAGGGAGACRVRQLGFYEADSSLKHRREMRALFAGPV